MVSYKCWCKLGANINVSGQGERGGDLAMVIDDIIDLGLS